MLLSTMSRNPMTCKLASAFGPSNWLGDAPLVTAGKSITTGNSVWAKPRNPLPTITTSKKARKPADSAIATIPIALNRRSAA